MKKVLFLMTIITVAGAMGCSSSKDGQSNGGGGGGGNPTAQAASTPKGLKCRNEIKTTIDNKVHMEDVIDKQEGSWRLTAVETHQEAVFANGTGASLNTIATMSPKTNPDKPIVDFKPTCLDFEAIPDGRMSSNYNLPLRFSRMTGDVLKELVVRSEFFGQNVGGSNLDIYSKNPNEKNILKTIAKAATDPNTSFTIDKIDEQHIEAIFSLTGVDADNSRITLIIKSSYEFSDKNMEQD